MGRIGIKEEQDRGNIQVAGVEPVAFATSIIKTCNEIEEVTSYDTQIIDNVLYYFDLVSKYGKR